jgi:hypothetical protein
MTMIKFDTRLKSETIEALKKEANKDGRSVCGMARKILEDYFKYPNSYTPGRGGIIYGPDKKDGLNTHELATSLEKLKNMLALSDSDIQQNDFSEFYKNMPEETIKANSDLNKK